MPTAPCPANLLRCVAASASIGSKNCPCTVVYPCLSADRTHALCSLLSGISVRCESSLRSHQPLPSKKWKNGRCRALISAPSFEACSRRLRFTCRGILTHTRVSKKVLSHLCCVLGCLCAMQPPSKYCSRIPFHAERMAGDKSRSRSRTIIDGSKLDFQTPAERSSVGTPGVVQQTRMFKL